MKFDKELLWLIVAVVCGLLVGFFTPLGETKNPAPWGRISEYTGWVYFFCWSVSFWPQIYLNFTRKSTVGLSFDYQLLNFIGFACYATFNCGLYWSKEIQDEYQKTHGGKSAAVRFNDVLFALHAFGATSVTLFQIYWYRNMNHRGDEQRTTSSSSSSSTQLDNPVGLYGMLSTPPRSTISLSPRTPSTSKCVRFTKHVLYVIVAVFLLSVAVICMLAWLGVDAVALTWLNVLYYLSSAKLAITIIKYIPQVYENWRRKSTDGWNIWNVLLDFGGGSLSICQLMIDCGSTGNWSGLTGDPVKFLLGFVSIIFDLVFMIQHYCLYRFDEKLSLGRSDPLLGSGGGGGDGWRRDGGGGGGGGGSWGGDGRRGGSGRQAGEDEWLNLNPSGGHSNQPNLYDSWLDN